MLSETQSRKPNECRYIVSNLVELVQYYWYRLYIGTEYLITVNNIFVFGHVFNPRCRPFWLYTIISHHQHSFQNIKLHQNVEVLFNSFVNRFYMFRYSVVHCIQNHQVLTFRWLFVDLAFFWIVEIVDHVHYSRWR